VNPQLIDLALKDKTPTLTSIVSEMPQIKDSPRKEVKVRLTYTDRHIEYRVCKNLQQAAWAAHMEGDHLQSWEII